MCHTQMSRRYQALREALGLPPTPDPTEAVSEDDCVWCRVLEERRTKQGAEGGVKQHPGSEE